MRAPEGRGNPLSYYNGKSYTFTWEEGRNLISAVEGTNTYTYTYDQNGIRTSKTVNGKTYTYAYDSDGLRLSKTVDGVKHEYFYASGKLLRETYGNVTLDFLYDNSGYPYALIYKNGTAAAQTYYYITNLQGDVLYLLDSAENVVAAYEYGPYGEVTTTVTSTIAEMNPLRYRGYYYDFETGLYYLLSRYFDSSICRFINADSYASTGYGVIGNNMFGYCLNNPTNYTDTYGEFPVILIVIIGGTIVGAGCGAYIAVCDSGDISDMLIGALEGGLTGLASTSIGLLSPSAGSAILAGTLSGAGIDFLTQCATYLIICETDESFSLDWSRVSETALTTGLSAGIPVLGNPQNNIIDAIGTLLLNAEGSFVLSSAVIAYHQLFQPSNQTIIQSICQPNKTCILNKENQSKKDAMKECRKRKHTIRIGTT